MSILRVRQFINRKMMVKGLFIGLLVVAPIQFLFAEFFIEPWPALMGPSFRGVPSKLPYVYRSTNVDIIAKTREGKQVIIPQKILMENIPVSHRGSLMIYQFRPTSVWTGIRRQPPSWLPIYSYPLNNYFYPRRNYPLGNSPETRGWLQQKLSQHYSDYDFVSVEFIWHTSSVSMRDGEWVVSAEETWSYVVDLFASS